MSASSPLISSMGANITEYSQPLSIEAEAAEFDWASEKIKLLIDILKGLPSLDRVADIGCRTGGQAAYYRDQAGIREMHGFEISSVPLLEAQKKGIIGHEWISGISPCPVEDNYFDAVIAGDLIEHLMDTDVFLDELYRVIRPGGFLIITTPNIAWWRNRVRLLMGKVPANIGSVSFNHARDRGVDKKHLRVSVANEWTYLFEQHGLEMVSTLGYHYPKLLRFPASAIDRACTKIPTLSHSCLFLMRKPES
jgi:ubiquinone/menaquinone biosynthesis C-methylase UbiE